MALEIHFKIISGAIFSRTVFYEKGPIRYIAGRAFLVILGPLIHDMICKGPYFRLDTTFGMISGQFLTEGHSCVSQNSMCQIIIAKQPRTRLSCHQDVNNRSSINAIDIKATKGSNLNLHCVPYVGMHKTRQGSLTSAVVLFGSSLAARLHCDARWREVVIRGWWPGHSI